MVKTMTGAEIVVQALIDQGVDTIFGYPGGAVLPIYDAIFKQKKIKHILEHENIKHVTLELEKEEENCTAMDCTIVSEKEDHHH